jgi:hypothetical protein
MDIHLLRKDVPLEPGAIYQYTMLQARGTQGEASDIVETEAYPSQVSLPDDYSLSSVLL